MLKLHCCVFAAQRKGRAGRICRPRDKGGAKYRHGSHLLGLVSVGNSSVYHDTRPVASMKAPLRLTIKAHLLRLY